MSRFQDLSSNKVYILDKLINNQNLCKAVHYTEANFLDQPDINDTSSLLYENLFPYYMIPSTDAEKHTYINLSFRNFEPVGNSFKSGEICIYVITHKDLVRTDYGWLRYDYIISEIDKLLNEQRGSFIGKLRFHHMGEIIVNPNYLGQYISYQMYEFN